jgi:hypothetical protein
MVAVAGTVNQQAGCQSRQGIRFGSKAGGGQDLDPFVYVEEHNNFTLDNHALVKTSSHHIQSTSFRVPTQQWSESGEQSRLPSHERDTQSGCVPLRTGTSCYAQHGRLQSTTPHVSSPSHDTKLSQ